MTKLRTLLWIFASCISISAFSQKPELYVSIQYSIDSAAFKNIDSLKYDARLKDAKCRFKFKWEAKNSQYVLIDGLDSIKHAVNDSVILSRGGNFTFIAVGKNNDDIIRKIHGASIILTDVPGGGNYMEEVIYSKLNSEEFFKTGYRFTIETEKSLENVKDIVFQVLQSKKYVVETNREIAYTFLTEFIVSTTECIPNNKVCGGLEDQNDCSKNPDNRRFQRKIGFSVMASSDIYSLSTEKKKRFFLEISPSVVRRYRRVGGEWKTDPESPSIAKLACDELSKEILDLVNGKK